MKKEHQAPWECTYVKEEESRCRPGAKPKSNKEYFEIMCLCVLQAGLGWGMVRKNWDQYKRGFYGFSINRLAAAKVESLLESPGVLRNKRKVSAIVYNAKEFKRIMGVYGSFSVFLDSLRQYTEEDVLAQLTSRFHHLGNYSAEYFLHCVGYWE
ncbi:MAG: DNA-3-methyladenine glycosylase I [Thermoplasmata archaeon]|nr:MAG: DNA-3-methyladenine glycosylase I [Thermoplasmata archaeon]